MKNFVGGLLAICLVVALVFGFAVVWDPDLKKAAAEETAEEAASAEMGLSAEAGTETAETETPAPVSTEHLDFAAIYALHEPDEKVLKIGDEEERWGDYFYLLYTQCGQIENYFDSLATYYGMSSSWSDPFEEGGESFAELAEENTESLMIQLSALERFAAENGIEVTEEMQEKIEAQKQEDIVAACGEGATEEEFFQNLSEIYLTPEMYERITTQNYLYQESFKAIYGEKAELLPEEEALAYLEDNAYVSAAHILFMKGEEGEDRSAELEEIRAELMAIEDPEERAEAFLAKMKESSEDTGVSYYPEGYTYTPGTMVPQFEDAVTAMEVYGISEIVDTDYGKHLIMRLPLSADAVVEFSSTSGEARTARMLAANMAYSAQLQEVADGLKLEWLPEHAAPVLTDYVQG